MGIFHQKLKWYHFIPAIGPAIYGVQNFNAGRDLRKQKQTASLTQAQSDLLRAYQEASPEIEAAQEREAEMKREAAQATENNIKIIVVGVISLVIIGVAAYLIFRKK
jgi:hypothetical protein